MKIYRSKRGKGPKQGNNKEVQQNRFNSVSQNPPTRLLSPTTTNEVNHDSMIVVIPSQGRVNLESEERNQEQSFVTDTTFTQPDRPPRKSGGDSRGLFKWRKKFHQHNATERVELSSGVRTTNQSVMEDDYSPDSTQVNVQVKSSLKTVQARTGTQSSLQRQLDQFESILKKQQVDNILMVTQVTKKRGESDRFFMRRVTQQQPAMPQAIFPQMIQNDYLTSGNLPINFNQGLVQAAKIYQNQPMTASRWISQPPTAAIGFRRQLREASKGPRAVTTSIRESFDGFNEIESNHSPKAQPQTQTNFYPSNGQNHARIRDDAGTISGGWNKKTQLSNTYYSNLHDSLHNNQHNRPPQVMRKVFPLKLDDAIKNMQQQQSLRPPEMIQEETARTYVSSIKNQSSNLNRQQSTSQQQQYEVVSTYRSAAEQQLMQQQMLSSRHHKRRSQLPRELPELSQIVRPVTKQDIIKQKRLSGIEPQVNQLVDDRMNKIATTLDRLNLQLLKFQEDLEVRQKDPLVNENDFMLTNSSQKNLESSCVDLEEGDFEELELLDINQITSSARTK